jgi:predicted nuclease of predicted toxin-antitoxin system
MRIKLDENLPESLLEILRGLGHDPDSVLSEGLRGEPDDVVFPAALADGRVLITQDLDFSDIRQFAPGTHPGLILVRLREPSRTTLRERIEWIFRTEPVETWAGCFVVVSDHKVRVRRPPENQTQED